MRKSSLSVPVYKPRNAVVRSLLGRLGSGTGRHKADAAKRLQARERADLVQRVYDCGQW